LESASIPIPAINVGMRQVGRFAGSNVIFTSSDVNAIVQSIHLAKSNNFVDQIAKMSNPYGDGRSSKRAFEIIKSMDFRKSLRKKEDPLDV